MKNIEEKEYTEADTTLDNARSQTQFNVGGQNILELLKWVSDLEKFDAERGGMSLTIFRNEGQMQELIKRWEDDVNEHNHLLGMIARYEPGFEGLRSRTFTRLRTIQNEAACARSRTKRRFISGPSKASRRRSSKSCKRITPKS